jgi:hypothetical protein
VCIDDAFTFDFLIKKHAYEPDYVYKLKTTRFSGVSTFIAMTYYLNKIHCYAYTFGPRAAPDDDIYHESNEYVIGTTRNVVVPEGILFVVDVSKYDILTELLYHVIKKYDVITSNVFPLTQNISFEYYYHIIHGYDEYLTVGKDYIKWSIGGYETIDSAIADVPVIANNITFHNKKIKYYRMETKKGIYTPYDYREFTCVSKKCMKFKRITMCEIDDDTLITSQPCEEWRANNGIIVIVEDPDLKKYQELVTAMDEYWFDSREFHMHNYKPGSKYAEKFDELKLLYLSGFFNKINLSCPILHFYISKYMKAFEDFYTYDTYDPNTKYKWCCPSPINGDMLVINSDPMIVMREMIKKEGSDAILLNTAMSDDDKTKAIFHRYAAIVHTKTDTYAVIHNEYLIFKYAIENYFEIKFNGYSYEEMYITYKKLRYLNRYTEDVKLQSFGAMFPKQILKKMLNYKYCKKIDKQMKKII